MMGDASGGAYSVIEVERIVPGFNPRRKVLRSEAFENLVTSIREQGIIEPLVVRRKQGEMEATSEVDSILFELVCGERRWLAAQEAGLAVVPCVVRELSDVDAIRVALVENLEREDLDPLEEARGFERLRQEGIAVEAIGKAIGRSQPYVSNRMRLQKLPGKVKEMVEEGKLAVAAAMPLLTLPAASAQERLAKDAVERHWSSRDVDREVKEYGQVIDPGLLKDAPFCAKCADCPKGEKGRFRRRSDRVRSIKCFDEGCYEKLRRRWEQNLCKEDRARLTAEAKKKIAKIVEAGGLATMWPMIGSYGLPSFDGGIIFSRGGDSPKPPCLDGRWNEDEGQSGKGEEDSGKGAKGQSGRAGKDSKPQGCRSCGMLFFIQWSQRWSLGKPAGKKLKLESVKYCGNEECWQGLEGRLWKEWCQSEEGKVVLQRAAAEEIQVLRLEEFWKLEFDGLVAQRGDGRNGRGGQDGQGEGDGFYSLEMCAKCMKGRVVLAIPQEDGTFGVDFGEVYCKNKECYEAQDWEGLEEKLDQRRQAVRKEEIPAVMEGPVPVEVWREILMEIVNLYAREKNLQEFWMGQSGWSPVGEKKAKCSFEAIEQFVERQLGMMQSDAGRVDWLQRMLCGSWVAVSE